MADEQTTTTESTTSQAPDAAHWQAEAKKAFEARQAAKKEADDLRKQLANMSGIDPEEYRTLKQQAEQAEQERAKKAGEFDKLQQQLVTKHQAEKADLEKSAKDYKSRWEQDRIGRAFGEAVDLFGPSGLTKYIPSEAEAIFAKHVRIEDDGAIVVLDSRGDVILDGKTGKPAAFSAGMAELIDSMPDKKYRLRGSGTTGSGSSGGATSSSPRGVDLNNLKASDFNDPKVREAIKRRQAEAGGMVFGSNFDRIAKP